MSMTTNEQSVVDEAAFAVRRTILIAAPVDKVWATVTEPALISRWFGRADFDANGLGTMTWDGRDPIPVRVDARDEPLSITYRWNNDDALGTSPENLDVEHSTCFTFTLEPVAGGTQLTVVETGFENTSDAKANLEFHRQGWNSELDKLVALLEGE